MKNNDSSNLNHKGIKEVNKVKKVKKILFYGSILVWRIHESVQDHKMT